MFRFANSYLLYLLLIVPLLVVLYGVVAIRRRHLLKKFGNLEIIRTLMPAYSPSRLKLKFTLYLLALVCVIVAAARPQLGSKLREERAKGVEMMLVVDISNSMLAEDFEPNRLERTKYAINKLFEDLQQERVGLVVFAGEAFTQLPITCDYVSAKMFLNTITPNLIPTQGTAIGAALQTAITSFGATESEAGRAIILITDGENHEDDAIAAAQKAQELGIQVFVVGIGKPEGSPIPKPGTNDYFKDRSGQVVVSRLNEEMCQQIAEAGNGIYVRCDNTNTAMRALQQGMEHIATAELESTVYADYNEQYQSFVLIALLLIAIEFFILSRKNHKLARMDLFGEKNE